MMSTPARTVALAIGSAMVLTAASAAQGTHDDQVSAPVMAASESFSGSIVSFSVSGQFSHYMIKVSGPDGYHAEVFDPHRMPTLRLEDFGATPDGVYHYEVIAATFEYGPAPTFDDGRETTQRPRVGAVQNGSFHVSNGRIMPRVEATEEQ